MLISFFFTFLFIPCDRLSWLSVSFLLHVAQYRIVFVKYRIDQEFALLAMVFVKENH